MGGVWVKVESDRCIQTSGKNNPGDTVEAGLPNIRGFVGRLIINTGNPSGAFYKGNSGSSNIAGGSATPLYEDYFDASKSNSIYGNSKTVQPPAYIVIGWKRES